jgi:hypothetical protein
MINFANDVLVLICGHNKNKSTQIIEWNQLKFIINGFPRAGVTSLKYVKEWFWFERFIGQKRRDTNSTKTQIKTRNNY